jgi:hypothetical protein
MAFQVRWHRGLPSVSRWRYLLFEIEAALKTRVEHRPVLLELATQAGLEHGGREPSLLGAPWTCGLSASLTEALPRSPAPNPRLRLRRAIYSDLYGTRVASDGEVPAIGLTILFT